MPAAGPSLDFEGFPSLAGIEVAANAYVTGQKLCVFELLVHVCTKYPSRVREYLRESGRSVAKGFWTHGDDALVPIPDIMNLQQRKAAAEAHAGLCRVHHADCIARITLELLLCTVDCIDWLFLSGLVKKDIHRLLCISSVTKFLFPPSRSWCPVSVLLGKLVNCCLYRKIRDQCTVCTADDVASICIFLRKHHKP